MSTLRFAVFYNGNKSKPWAVVTQYRNFWGWWWSDISVYNTDDEAWAMKEWRKDVEREKNKHLDNGIQKTEWAP